MISTRTDIGASRIDRRSMMDVNGSYMSSGGGSSRRDDQSGLWECEQSFTHRKSVSGHIHRNGNQQLKVIIVTRC